MDDLQFYRDTFPLKKFISQLSKALVRNGLPHLVPSSHTEEVCSLFFNWPARVYGFNIANMHHEPDWHVIEVPFESSLFEVLDLYPVSRSRTHAVALVLQACDERFVTPTSLEHGDAQSLSLVSGSEVLASIKPLVFSSAPPRLTTRIATALKRTADDNKRAAAERLRKIPELQGLETESIRPAPYSESFLLNFTPQALAWQLQRMLSGQFGIETTLSLAQEVIAQTFGAPSWNHYIANSQRNLCWLAPAAFRPSDRKTPLYFRTLPEALAAFAESACKQSDQGIVLARKICGYPDIECFGFRIASNGLLVDWRVEMDEWKPDAGICSPQQVIEGTHFADALRLASTSVEDSVADYFRPDAAPEVRWELSYKRRYGGVTNVKTLRIREWLFSWADDDDPSTTVEVGKISSQGEIQLQRFGATPYKADLYFKDGVARLLHDYGRFELLTDNWTSEEAELLTRETGIKLHMGFMCSAREPLDGAC